MPRHAKDAPPYAITSVDHALRLIRLLQTEGALRVSDAAARLQVAPSTAHRLLAMLVYRDFAHQQPDRRYVAGPALAGHPDPVDAAPAIRDAAMPHLEGLMARTRETVGLAVLHGRSAVFIASVEGARALRVGGRDGQAFPAHLASVGKVLLAELDEAEIRRLYDPAHFPDPASAPSLDLLLPELSSVRATGIAVNHEGTERGVSAVAQPVHDASRRVVAAVSVSVPSARFDEPTLRELRRHLATTVLDIERCLVTHGGHAAP